MNEARVVQLFLFALLLLTIVAILSGRIGFTGEWATVGVSGHAGTSMRPALSFPRISWAPKYSREPPVNGLSLFPRASRSESGSRE
jgi:hypothetical protein